MERVEHGTENITSVTLKFIDCCRESLLTTMNLRGVLLSITLLRMSAKKSLFANVSCNIKA